MGDIMRKKSHISLASYLMKSMKTEELVNHKKAFYLGSILPDCVPSFIIRRHCIEGTFEVMKAEILKITDDYDMDKGITRYYCRHLGVITHYVADYFTFPHNEIFEGTLREHCSYEKDLKFALRTYVKSDEAKQVREKNGTFQTVDDICKFIAEMHKEYLKAIKVVKMDCMYIVALCHKVVDAILQIFELNFSTHKQEHVYVT
jgi:hypothetical protein